MNSFFSVVHTVKVKNTIPHHVTYKKIANNHHHRPAVKEVNKFLSSSFWQSAFLEENGILQECKCKKIEKSKKTPQTCTTPSIIIQDPS
jgi:hypothetical protein